MPPERKALVGLNVHVNPTPFEYATRILKVTQALTDGGIVNRTVVVGRQKAGLPARERLDDHREVLRVGPPFGGGSAMAKALWFLRWSWKVFRAFDNERIAMVNCHTLSTLPVSVLLKLRHRAILVYEPHELETETITTTGLRRRLSRLLERALIGQAARVIVVSESIARAYEREYGLAGVPVIMNAPPLQQNGTSASGVFREKFGIPPGETIFMYQGDLSAPRGVPQLLEAFAKIPADRHLVLMGFGPLEDTVKKAAADNRNIHFHPAVPPSQVLTFTRGADVGFALLTDDCLNHRYALPNKFFHYLHAGLPVIVSDLPELGGAADRYGCGWRVGESAADIAGVVAAIDPAAIEAKRAGARRARDEMNWDREAVKLVGIYRDLLASGAA